ncbi:MAG TPA: hypothetical protein PLO44_00610 [Candidatus Paceibacterota bacterium]|nr:hypothetical protein [Candidatus Paceibacterota bacterium]
MKNTVKIIRLVIILVMAFLFIFWVKSFDKKDNSNDKKATDQTEQYSENSTGTEIIVFDGFTPCDPVINFKFRLETFGEPVYEKFTGVSEEFFFDGKDNPGTPAGAKGGTVSIKSANPNKPHVRVVVYKINK